MSDGFISLLPQNATPHERAMEMAQGRISKIPVPIRHLWNPDTCPLNLLVQLAWAFGVDEWQDDWSEDTKRATVRDAINVQRRKGTVWSVKRALKNAGLGTAQLVEGLYSVARNGSQKRNGLVLHGDSSQWATYRLILDRPITNNQAQQVRRILYATAPARCKLVEFVFLEANNSHNGAILRNGQFNRGTA